VISKLLVAFRDRATHDPISLNLRRSSPAVASGCHFT
jgi:hypothetical protein